MSLTARCGPYLLGCVIMPSQNEQVKTQWNGATEHNGTELTCVLCTVTKCMYIVYSNSVLQ